MVKYVIIFSLGCLVASAQDNVAPGAVAPEASLTPDKIASPATARAPVAIPVDPDPVSQAELAQSELVLPKRGSEDAVRLQIFLDQKHFGPGVIDGKPGLFTKLAIENYNVSLGRNKNDTQVLNEAVTGVPEAYATAITPSMVDKYVDRTLPTKRSLQAKRKAMSYRSVGELMAERYHMSEDLLVTLNGAKAVREAKARTALKVLNIEPFLIETLKAGRTHKKEEVLSARHVVVDTEIKQVLIYELKLPEEDQNGVKVTSVKPMLIASFPITPGKSKFIPKGFWNLKNSVELPVWRYDQQMLDTGVRGKNSLSIPPGPNNPIGVIWNGLTKSGIGIHGTNNPVTIGRARSSGCIRLANWDAARFPNLVRPGAVVVIR